MNVKYHLGNLPVDSRLISDEPGVEGRVVRHYRRERDWERMVDIQWNNGKLATYALADVTFEKLPRQCPHCGAFHACTVRDRWENPCPPTCAACGKVH